jgi:hypothetical protein
MPAKDMHYLFSLSVLGLPQMMLRKRPMALQKSRGLSPEISSKNG